MRAEGLDRADSQAQALVAELSALGIRLWADNGSLRFDAPVGVFSQEQKDLVRQHKAAILSLLAGGSGEGTAPLSCQQERMWFLDHLEDTGSLYAEGVFSGLEGDLDEAALLKSLDWVLARHPALRTVFRDGATGPEQVVQPAAEAALTRVDLSSLEGEQQAEAQQQAMRGFVGEPLDLMHGPIIRFCLLRLAQRKHVFGICAHHAAVDGWSGGILDEDLALAYNAYRQGQKPVAPPPAATYAAYATAQRRLLDDGSLDQQAAAWARELADVPMTPGLPTDYPRPQVRLGRGADLPLALTSRQVTALTALGHAQSATLFAVLLAAYGVMQARISGRRRLLIGVPVAGRPSPELDTVVGYFSNTVPVLLDLSGIERFSQAVARTSDGVFSALARQDIPLERLIRAVSPARASEYSPLFQTVFSLQPRPMLPPALAGLKVTRLPGPPQQARYDLSLVLGQTETGQADGFLVYDADLFSQATAEAWRADFLELLSRAAAGDDPLLGLAGSRAYQDLPAAEGPATGQEQDQPASPGQEGMWLDRRDQPPSVVYSVPFRIQLPAGQATPELVKAALELITARQEAMRTVLVERDGVLRQRVLPPGPADLTVHDLRGEPDPEPRMADLTQADLAKPFDLAQGPLFRFHLCLGTEGRATLLGTADHAVFDDWSLALLRQEIAQTLAALAQGRRPELVPLPLSYAQAVRAWRDDLAGARGESLRTFWQERLPRLNLGLLDLGPPEADSLSQVGPAEAVCAQQACPSDSRYICAFSPEAWSSLRALAASQRTTPAVVWAAAVAALFARYKDGEGNVAVGVPFAGRRDARAENIIGFFVNLLPVSLPHDWSLSFGELLDAAQTEMAALLGHQDTPLPWLAAEAVRAGLTPGAPLFDAVALLVEGSEGGPGLQSQQGGEGKFPLMLTLTIPPGGDGQLALDYSRQRFSRASMARMAEHLQRLLVAAAADPQRPLGELDILTDRERQLLLTDFNGTARDYPRDASLAALFCQAASRHADRPAVVWAQGSRTYADLNRESDRLAAGLAQAGARPGEVVALFLERGPQAVVATVGVVKAGCAYLPLDPGFPLELVRRLLDDCGAKMVVADARGRTILSGLGPGPVLLALEDLALDAPPPADPPGGLAPAYVMFTSGTTGEPKGVMVPQRGVVRLALTADYLALSPQDGMAQAAPLGFDAATLEIWAPLLNGARVCFLEDDALTHPALFKERLSGLGVSVMWLTASLMNRLAEEDPACFSTLRVLLTGGEVLSAPHVLRVLEACPNLTLINGYGPTENTTFTTIHLVSLAEAGGASIPIGRPIPNTSVYVLDRLGSPAPLGIWGELYTGGDGLALGYAGRPELTAQAFVSPAWLPGQRLYRTGDLARWRDDGVLLFGGRRDTQVKVRGHRVEISAIEAGLRALPGVGDAAVFALGQGAERILDAVVAAPQNEEDKWRAALAQRLPAYMVPGRFLVLEQLPVTANGKADRRALAAMLAQVGTAAAPRAGQPASDGERLLIELWGQIFPGAALNTDSDFFSLGGHSLMIMRLAGLIERGLGWRPAVRGLMNAPRLGDMAKLIEAGPATGQPATIPKAAGPDYPLSSGQARLWMLARLYPDTAAYNVPMVLDLHGELDARALQRALTALEERQHALRLRLAAGVENRGEMRQVLAPAGDLVLRQMDCSDCADPQGQAEALVAQQVQLPFRLEHEPPARAILLRLGPRRWRLILVLHHSACDGWSLPVLWRDLGSLYARETGRPGERLPALPTGYEDFAAYQQAFLASRVGRELLARWRKRLTPLPEPLALPLDRPRPASRRFRGDFLETAFSQQTSQAIEAMAAALGVTPFVWLLGLLQVLLWRHGGQREFCLGTLVAGRERAALNDLLGFFVNTLVLRQQLDPGARLADHLAAVSETLLTAITDQDCPFEALVEAVGAPRDTSRNPLFDVLAVWQEDPQITPELPGLEVSLVNYRFPFAKFDLGFYFFRAQGAAIGVQIEYDTDLFDRESVEALWGRLRHLMAQAISQPGLTLAELDILRPAERQLVVNGFNDTSLSLDIERVIPAPFLEQVAQRPEAPAVLVGQESLSYAQFASRAAGVAAELLAAGVKPGQVVALCARRSPEMLLGIHGILLAGAAYAPLDPDHPETRRAGMLEDLADPLVLAAPEFAALFGGRRVLTLGAESSSAPARPPSQPSDLAYVIFTSGSTGRPKGVMIEHRGVLNRILWMQRAFPLGPGDVILQKTPITFDVSVWELFWWSWVGASVALPPPGAERNPQALVEAVFQHGVTVMHFVPSMLAEFLGYLESGRADVKRLAGLKYVFASGEALDAGLVERFNRLLHAPHGVELHNLYGPTEATVDVSWQPCSPWSGGNLVPIGKPIANTRLHVLDKDLRPLPVGVAGEICIGGVQVGRGYINRPELTREVFVADPFVSGGRIYRTGDLARWRRDGTVEYLGRGDYQVKVRGHRIELAEIEHALEQYPGVERAAVLPVQAAGLVELHAHVLGGEGLDGASLRAHLRRTLPEYMLPARFLRLDRLPLTSSGKLDRKALQGRPLDNAQPTPGLAPFEAEILALWRELLPGLALGVRDSFFESGGNSLLVIRLHERLEQRWPGVFSVADLFGRACVADQASLLAAKLGADQAASPGPEAARAQGEPVAIVGLAVRLPGCEDLASFWRDLAHGEDRVRPLPPQRQAQTRELLAVLGRSSPAVFREAAYLDDVYGFDYGRLRLAPMDAALLDPEQRLFLETAVAALEDAGYGGSALDQAKVGVFVGASPLPYYREAMGWLYPERAEQVFVLNVPSNLATRLSYLHDWRGPAALVDTACSSGLAAVHLACRSLAAGECQAALVGSAKVLLLPPSQEDRLTIDSSTARTRAFAAEADGTGMGEGAVAMLLKPLHAALAQGDAIHAVILGSALNQDGASSSMAAPNPEAQAQVITAAAQAAGVGLGSLSYVEAHGTGTALGDPVEVSGLTMAFARDTAETGFAALGAVKGNYGHLDAAAGVLGLAKAVLCLKQDAAPPQPFFAIPNQRIDFAKAPVRVPKALEPLAQRGGPRRAGVSSFGLSGINAHVILESAPRAEPEPEPEQAWYVIGLSAATSQALRAYAHTLAEALRAEPGWTLASLALTLALGREGLEWRAALATSRHQDLLDWLDACATGKATLTQAPPPGPGGRVASASVNTAGRQEAEAQARVFLAGGRLSWPEQQRPRRLHLPPAPFVRKPCRPPFATLIKAGPLLPEPVATPQGQAWRVPLEEPAYWPLAEHRLHGQPTLVAMALPGLLAEAASSAGLGPGLLIEDLAWLRPLRADAVQPGTASLLLASQPDGAGREAILGAFNPKGRWTVFAQARLSPTDATPPAPDLPLLRARFSREAQLAPFTPFFGPLEVSQRWDCLERAWLSGDDSERLGLLRAMPAVAGDRQGFPLHPALLDVAASLVLDRPGRLPAGCAALRILAPLPAEVLAHVRRRHADQRELLADVSLLDPSNGQLVLTMTGLRFVSPGAAENVSITPPDMSVPSWRPSSLPVGTACPGPLVVIGEGPLAQRLGAHLRGAGLLAGQCGSTEPDRALIASVLEGHCAGLLLAPSGGDDLAWRAAAVLRALLSSLHRPVRVLLAGHGAYALDDTDPSPGPEAGLLAGLSLAVAQEEALLAVRYMDLDQATPPAMALAELAAMTSPADLSASAVLWRDGLRYLQTLLPLPSPAMEPAWPQEGCCLVTGGLGGFALTLAMEMAARGKVALALVSRRGVAGGDGAEARFQRMRLAELEHSGVRFKVYACDVADRAALASTLIQVRADLGPITAVAHAAGLADGAFLMRRERDEFQNVLAAKVLGARHLDELTRQDQLQAFVLFGSLSGLGGAPGQAAYTAANAYLASLAIWRRRQGRPGLCVDWCPLEGVGMAARSQWAEHFGPSINAAQAQAAWKAALSSGRERVSVLALAHHERGGSALRPVVVSAAGAASPPPAGADQSQAGDLGQAVAAIWSQVLGYEQVGLEDNFFSLGGDSITAMQIVNRVVAELGRPASLAIIFEHPTPGGLAEALGEIPAAQPTLEITAAAPSPDYPVSWEQLAVLRAEAAGDMGTAFNLPCLVQLPSDVDVDRLRAALEQLVARHEILRTSFLRAGDDFRMRVSPRAPLALPEVAIPTGVDHWEAGRRRVRPFDLFAGPPLRHELLRPAQGPPLLFLDVHHVLADGLSQEILVAELAALYGGQNIPAPSRQFKDYACWSREGAGASRARQDLAWWRERFAGPLPLTDLPADHPRPLRHTWRGDTVSFTLAPDLLSDLRAYAASNQVSAFSVVLATWAALVHRLTRAEDIVIAVPADYRDSAGLADLPGMLVSLLPLRLTLGASLTTAELVRQAHMAHVEALGHRACNLGMLLADLAPPAAPDRTLLSEIALSYMNFAEAAPAAGQPGAFNLLGLTRDSCKNDLGIFIRDLPGQMVISLEYYADLFERPRMEQLGRQFEALLAGLVRGPARQPVAALPLLSAQEQANLLAWGQGPMPDLPLEAGIFSLFAGQAQRRGQAVALEEVGHSLTYAQLHAQALALSQGLRRAGVGPRQRVAVHMRRGCPVVAMLLGILAAGAAYVPLDPAYPAERNRFILADSQCRVVVADIAGRQALGADLPCPVLAAEELAGSGQDQPAMAEPPKADGSWPAYVMYTSGSTGQPKGVLIPQRGVIRLAMGADYAGLSQDDRLLQTGPLAFDASTFEIWGALLNGARVCIAAWEDLVDPSKLGGLIKRFEASVIVLTTGLFNRQVDHDPASFQGARVVIAGGEQLSAPHARRAMAACPEVTFVNGYGPTENTTFSIVQPLSEAGLDACPAAIGRPIPCSSALVLDETGGLMPQGVWGEICVGGPGLADGYLGRDDLTAQRFVSHPWQPGERLYRTGDQGRWLADGVIEFGGRLDNQIKLRGLRIELGEIEAALAGHPAVRRAVALLLRPEAGEPEIAAALLPAAEGVTFDLATLRQWLGRSLPAYMIPSRILTVGEIPLTANGKVDQKVLLGQLEKAGDLPGEQEHAPATPTEVLVAEIFSEVFGRPVRDRRTGFLDLGGHSLLAIKVVNRLAERVGVRPSMGDFYASTSLADLAALVERSLPPAHGDIPPAPPAAFHPTSHSQQRLYLLHQLEGGSGAYNMCFVFRCAGSLDAAAFAQALRRLCRRHEPLRTGLEEQDGQIVQRVSPEAEPDVAVDDLRGRDDAWEQALRLARQDASMPFDLGRPPLVRTRIMRVHPEETLVFLVLHHIVGDGWSSRILVRELGALYAEGVSGQPARLASLPLTYKDFAVWQRSLSFAGEADFWRQKLAGAPPRIALPTSRPVPEKQSYRGATRRLDLEPQVLSGLRALARRHQTTLGTIGLALFAALLFRLTRQQDMVLGMGVAGRERAGLEGLIGFFVNVLPIRLALDDGTEFDSLVSQVRATVLEALDHRDYPFDLLVRDLAPVRQGNRQPLMNVVFEYQNFGSLRQEGPGLPVKPDEGDQVAKQLGQLLDSPTAKHDLLVFLVDEGERAQLQMEYDTDILEPEVAGRWLGYLAQFAAMVSQTDPGPLPA